MKSIASEFGPQYDIVSAIEPLNESVLNLLLYARVLCLTLNLIGLLDTMDRLY